MLVMAQRGFLCVFFLFLLLASPHAAMLRWNLPARSLLEFISQRSDDLSHTHTTDFDERQHRGQKNWRETIILSLAQMRILFLALVLCRIRLVFYASQVIAKFCLAYPPAFDLFFSNCCHLKLNQHITERSTILAN